MPIDILVVAKHNKLVFDIIQALGLPDANVVFLDNTVQAIKNVRRNKYDLIILGDKVNHGDTYDVGLELKSASNNKQSPVICIGRHKGRRTRLINLLRPQSIGVDRGNLDTAVSKIINSLETDKKITVKNS